MNLKRNIMNLYNLLQSDENLMRLLIYIPKNQEDNPLSKDRQDINSLPSKERYTKIKKVLIPSDKLYKLDLDSKICRICFYSGERDPKQNYSRSVGRMVDNPYIADQFYNFDIYVHIEVNNIDFRLEDIKDRLSKVLFKKNIGDIGELSLNYGHHIPSTPDGYVGYRLIYSLSSSQETFKDGDRIVD